MTFRPTESVYLFIEDIIQFFLAENGIVWQPKISNREVPHVQKLFDQSIGTAAIKTYNKYNVQIDEQSRKFWNKIVSLKDNITISDVLPIFDDAASEIYDTGDEIENTFKFLVFIGRLSLICHQVGHEKLIEVFIAPSERVLNTKFPSGFVVSFDRINVHAIEISTKEDK